MSAIADFVAENEAAILEELKRRSKANARVGELETHNWMATVVVCSIVEGRSHDEPWVDVHKMLMNPEFIAQAVGVGKSFADELIRRLP